MQDEKSARFIKPEVFQGRDSVRSSKVTSGATYSQYRISAPKEEQNEMEKRVNERQSLSASDEPNSAVIPEVLQAIQFGSIQLGPFWKHRPKVWFINLEYQFLACDIHSDDVKLGIVLRHLDEETILSIADALEEPPASNKYEHIKTVLITKYRKSMEKEFTKLIEEMELTDKTPSALLSEIRTLLPFNVQDDVLKKLWLQKLPEHTQELLVLLQDDITVDKLAEFADILLNRMQVATETTSSKDAAKIKALEDQIHKLLGVAAESKTDKRFQQVHLDVIGKLPNDEDYSYCLVMVDHNTRWPEAAPLLDLTAESIGDAFVRTWVSRFGTPRIITTDGASQFQSKLFDKLTKQLGCVHIVSSGVFIDKWHCTLEKILLYQLKDNYYWLSALPLVLLGLRTAYKPEIQCSSAAKMYDKNVTLPAVTFKDAQNPVHFREDNPMQILSRIRPRHENPLTITPFVQKELEKATHVFVCEDTGIVDSSIEQPYNGPYRVLGRADKKCYTVMVADKECRFGIDRLKPAFQEFTGSVPSARLSGNAPVWILGVKTFNGC